MTARKEVARPVSDARANQIMPVALFTFTSAKLSYDRLH
jgi:hypothetical protein